MDWLNPDTREFDWVETLFMTHRLFSPNDNEIILKLLQGLVRNINWRPEDVRELFDALVQRFESVCRTERSHLLTWLIQMLHWIQINYITPTWRSNSERSLLEMVRDTAMTNEALKVCLADDEDKTLDEIIEEIRDGELNQVNDKLLAEVRDIVSSVQAALESTNSGSQLNGLKKDLLSLCQAAEKAHFRPRLTQMVSWCLMALSKTGRLIQVGTGEGKSCIVAMFAAFRALRGEKVDIMSSSSVLAERDTKEWKKFYDHLKIRVDCNINKQDEDLKECYKSQIVYGTVEQFSGDWLKHHVLRMDIFGPRTFQCAIVDEVDSLMLDKGHHVLYMSSDMPALQHLNPLLALIWATANQYSKLGSGHIVGQKYPFHQVVLKQIKQEGVFELTVLQMAEDTGVLAKGTVEEIWRTPSQVDEKTANVPAKKLVEFFTSVETRFPSCQFALHSINKDGSVEELNRSSGGNGQRRVSLLLNGGFCQYMYPDTDSVVKAVEEDVRRFLHFTPCELNKSEGSCYIPGFLSGLVEFKLKVWIENAFHAQNMERDQEYVLESHGIVPVDYSSTGVVQNFMTLSDGLHQFLEMKHQMKLSDMTTITNYMSNIGLLQKYQSQIYGLSGTLGQQAEIETMKKICEGVTICQIPSFKRRKLFEVQGLIMKDEKEWREKIYDVITEQTHSTTYRDGRAVLVICETIKEAKIIHRAFGRKVPKKMLYINNNMDNTAISETFQEGDVIIATNLAGRGTDLKISESVKKAGGLFVLQTFLPKNARVEAQAFGRAGRQGSPGSGQLILHIRQLPHTLPENSHLDMMMAKNVRDGLAAEELHAYMKFHIPKIKKEERLFIVFLEKLNLLYKRANNKPLGTDVSALNEFWGIWLLTKVSEKDSIEMLTKHLEGDLDKALERLRQQKSPSSNLHHYTLHGKYLQKMGKLSESIQMYTRAIKQDYCWAAVAYYNRAFASLTQQNNNQKPGCLSQALADLQNALQSVELYYEQLQVMHRYITKQIPESERKDTRFDKQAMARVQVLFFFKANINEALQKVDRAMKRGGHVKVEEKIIWFLVSLKDFLPSSAALLKAARHSRDLLKMYQLISQPSFDIIKELESLHQIGLTHIYELDALFSLGGFISKMFSLT